MKNILKCFTLKDWGILGFIMLLILIQVNIDLMLPGYVEKISLFLLNENDNILQLLKIGGMMLLFAFFSFAISIVNVVLNARIGTNFSVALRKKIFYKVQEMSLEEERGFTVASLITRTTNDIGHTEYFVLAGIQMIIQAPILGIGAFLKIFGKDWRWSLVTGIAIFILIIVVVIGLCLTVKKYQKIQLLNDKINSITRERIIGVETIRAYNAEKYHEKRFNSINNEMVNTNLFTNIVMTIMSPIMNLIMNGLTLSIYWIGMSMILKAELHEKAIIFSEMMAYSQYALKLASAFLMLISVFLLLPQAIISVKRISEVFHSQTKIKNGNINVSSNILLDTKIEFRNVSFKYSNGNDNVLENISFMAKKGETVALIGSTGCGKTTLVNLIPRFYDVTSGSIIINGIDIKNYDLGFLRNMIGYVPQKVYLFSGTIASNIAYSSFGDDIDEEKVYEAIRIAGLDEFINSLDKGADETISHGGNNISGGQKQRLSIARAIYKQPDIIIFDDSFSALDYRTDILVRKALKEKCKNAIKIIVAQRINTVIDADKIIVMDHGKIVGIGTHNELIEKCEVYRQIVSSQLSGKEVL